MIGDTKLALFGELSDLTKSWNAFEDIPAPQKSECRELGRKLHDLGGTAIMREAYYHVKGANPATSILAAYWDGIGELAVVIGHTPTPWVLRDEGAPFTDVMAPDGRLLVTVYPELDRSTRLADPQSIAEAEATARHIVRCVNSHNGLVGTLKTMRIVTVVLFYACVGIILWTLP